MGAVRTILLLAPLAWASPALAQRVTDWRPYTVEASTRFGVPLSWIEAVIRAESRGRTHVDGRPIRSAAGAMGLMQLMPATWAEMRERLGLGRHPDEPRDNILAGTFYLRLMYERFGYPGLFGAYNAGPTRYARYLSGSRPLPRETADYLASVAPRASRAAVTQVGSPSRAATAKAVPPGIFVIRREAAEAPSTGEVAVTTSLFIALSQGR